MASFKTTYDRPPQVVKETVGPSLTKQNHKDECDINRIMARYKKTGQLPVNVGVARYGDFSQVGDFQTAQEILAKAKQQFEALPAHIRKRFDNNPGQLLAFIHDKSNVAEAQKLGFLKAEAQVNPSPEVKKDAPVDKA